MKVNRNVNAGVLALLASLTLAGCKPGSASERPEGDAVAPQEQAGRAEADERQPAGPALVFASSGVPHTAAISLIALDPEGAGALTRDTVGSVRLWAALDGSREPLPVPIRDPRSMALASDGAGGWVLALVDPSGGARIVAVDPSGKMQPLASLPPTDPLLEIAVLPGAKQLVAIGSDHVIRLLDPRGQELARLDSPGLRPASLRIAVEAEGGPRVVAVTAGEFDEDQGRFAVELLPLELGPTSVALAKQHQVVHLDSPPTADNPTISPDGLTAVFVQRQRLGGATWQVLAVPLDGQGSVVVDSQIGTGAQPRFGLLPEGRVLLDDGTGLGRVVDLRERELELVPLRSSPTLNHLASSFAAGVRAAPANSWLAVHELASDDLRYLGYQHISVTDAGLTPAGETVAWALADRVAIETDGEVFELPDTRGAGQRFVGFLDEELLLTLDWSGGAKLIRWTDAEVVDELDIGNDAQMATFARDGQGNGLLLVRTNLWQSPTIVELRERELSAHYLLNPAANLAGLMAEGEDALDEWGAWTIDGTGKLRTTTLAELREGIDSSTALAGGESFDLGTPSQFAISSTGERFWVRMASARPTLYRERGTSIEKRELAPGSVSMLVPSRDGRRVAVLQQRHATTVLTIIDASTLQPLWARPVPPINGMSWSDDGERLALPALAGGGVVFDGSNGEPVTARCGLAFQVRRSPTVVQGLFQQLNVCEL